MRLLIDECVDWRLLRDLRDHDVRTVKQAGWEKLDDGSLLRRASAEFDVFLTVDKDLPEQQDIAKFKIAVIILRARTTRLSDLRELLAGLHDALTSPKRGTVHILDWRDLPVR